MQKAMIRLYIEGKRSPLFSCEIADNAESAIASLEEKLNDRSKDTVRFGQACFRRDLFSHFEITYMK